MSGVVNFICHAVKAAGHVVENAINNPIQTIVDVGLIATGNPELVGAVNAANAVANGACVGKVIANAGVGYLGGEFAGCVGLCSTAGSIAARTGVQVAQGKCAGTAFGSNLAGAALGAGRGALGCALGNAFTGNCGAYINTGGGDGGALCTVTGGGCDNCCSDWVNNLPVIGGGCDNCCCIPGCNACCMPGCECVSSCNMCDCSCCCMPECCCTCDCSCCCTPECCCSGCYACDCTCSCSCCCMPKCCCDTCNWKPTIPKITPCKSCKPTKSCKPCKPVKCTVCTPLSSGTGTSVGTQSGKIPTPISGETLAAAPLYQNNQILGQIKQLYPQLEHVDPRILSSLVSNPSADRTAGSLMSTGLGAMASSGSTNPYASAVGSLFSNSGGENPVTGMPFKEGGALQMAHHEGGEHVPEFKTGTTGHYVKGRGDGQSDDIPAMLADGEYVFDADAVAALGNGSSDAGAKVLDKMRQNIRKHKRSAPPDKIPPKAKSPLEYLKGK